MKLRTLAKFGSTIPATLSTDTAIADDETSSYAAREYARYERQVLDFETEVRKRRDLMKADHIENMRVIFLNAEAAQ